MSLRKRVIATILLKNGQVVQSKGFKRYQVLGNPYTIISRLSNWQCDEIIYLDITRDSSYDLKRSDLKCPNLNDLESILTEVSQKCFVPLTVGGGIRTLEDIYSRIKSGADKVALNTQLINAPELIRQGATEFGSQCIVASIDCRLIGENVWEVCIDGGRTPTGCSPVDLAKEVESLGVGEILLNSIDHDGMANGFDLALIKAVSDATSVPVIAQGGAGNWQHMQEVLMKTDASAVAAANIFQHVENSVYEAKKYLFDHGLPVRKPVIKTMSSIGGI